jgi:hypothetical protein
MLASSLSDLSTSHLTNDQKVVATLLNSGWTRTRVKAGLPCLRVHDLKHTFERRLRKTPALTVLNFAKERASD